MCWPCEGDLTSVQVPLVILRPLPVRICLRRKADDINAETWPPAFISGIWSVGTSQQIQSESYCHRPCQYTTRGAIFCVWFITSRRLAVAGSNLGGSRTCHSFPSSQDPFDQCLDMGCNYCCSIHRFSRSATAASIWPNGRSSNPDQSS